MHGKSETILPILTPTQKQRNKLLFAVEKSVRYHVRRRQFFDRLEFWNRFLLVISGGATVTLNFNPESNHHVWTIVCGGFVAVFAAFDLIVGFSKAAREHNDLAKEFISLQGEIILAGNEISEIQVRELIGKRLKIEEKEPPKKRVLDVLCHNEIVKATGKNVRHLVRVGRFQKFVADFLDFRADGLEKVMDHKPVSET
jgi:hypothetical protein